MEITNGLKVNGMRLATSACERAGPPGYLNDRSAMMPVKPESAPGPGRRRWPGRAGSPAAARPGGTVTTDSVGLRRHGARRDSTVTRPPGAAAAAAVQGLSECQCWGHGLSATVWKSHGVSEFLKTNRRSWIFVRYFVSQGRDGYRPPPFLRGIN